MKRATSFGLLIFLEIISIGCEPEQTPVRHFVIEKGEHYASPRLTESLQSSRLAFEARFDESAIYDLGDVALQSSKNKLLGFSDCNSLHHQNSARFAWQWFNDRLEIYGYCYVNGERQEEYIGTVDINVYNKYEIELNPDYYIFRLNDQEPVYMNRGDLCTAGLYYKLWPYFGGENAAPHSVHVDIKMLY